MSHIPTAGVYALLNTVNGRVYVGSSVNIEHRLKVQLFTLRRWGGHGINRRIRKDCALYGHEAFQGVVLQRTFDVTELKRLETEWAERLGALGPGGYNAQPISRHRWDYAAAPNGVPEPRPQDLARFEDQFLLIANGYEDDQEAARALNEHGVQRPQGGRQWNARLVADCRRELALRMDFPPP